MANYIKKIDKISDRLEKIMDEVKAMEEELREELGEFMEYQKFTERYSEKQRAVSGLGALYDALEGVTFSIETARDNL